MRGRLWVAAWVAALGLGGCAPRVLRVGSSGDYPPFSVRSADGEWSGFDVDVARAWARDRGRRVELVPFRWPDLGDALARGDFEVAMSGVTVRPERLVAGDFTAGVATAEAVLVAPAGTPAPRRVAVNRGGHLERVARAALPDVELVAIDDNRRLLALVADGIVDGAVTDVLELRSAQGDLRVVAVLSRDRKAYWTAPAGAALARDLDAWLLAHEEDGTLPALRARYFGDAQRGPLAPPAARAVELLGRRLMLMPLVAEAKRATGRPIEDRGREQALEAEARATAAGLCLEPDGYLALVRAQFAAAKAIQRATLAGPPREAPPPTLAELRAAIDRVDAALAPALAAAAPIGAPPATLLAAVRGGAPAGAEDAPLRALAAALAGLRQAPCLPPSQQVSMIDRQRRHTSFPRSSITGPSHTGHASRHPPTASFRIDHS